MNDLCYRYEKLNLIRKPLFGMIDCCYVIILDNSKYETRIRKQLKRYPICKNILLQWNRGFRKCKKELPEQLSISDLTDSFKTILHNAIVNNYEYVMILEEDFLINNRIDEVVDEIEEFMINKKPEIITMGSILWASEDTEYNNFKKIRIKTGTHAIIINRKEIINCYNKINKSKDIVDIDIITNECENMYSYKIPLIIQVFSNTENNENWGSHLKNRNILIIFFLQIFKKFIAFLGFNKEDTIIDAYKTNYNIHFNKKYNVLRQIYYYIAIYTNKAN